MLGAREVQLYVPDDVDILGVSVGSDRVLLPIDKTSSLVLLMSVC